MEPKTGKRVVSKGKYVRAHTTRAVLSLLGVALTFLTLIPGTIAVVYFLYAVYSGFSIFQQRGVSDSLLHNLIDCLFSLTGGSIFVGAACLSKNLTVAVWKQLPKIDPGVPLTRANAADLPAPDSLVRASSEPMQAQEGVLLRAAAEGVERHEEQLVRASVGTE